MSAHTHPDDVLTANCPACVERVAADQRQALIAESPIRRCTWTCEYQQPVDEPLHVRTLTFTLSVRVPAPWTGWDVDEEYAHLTGDAFVSALPDSVPIRWTDYACESMDVRGVQIGAVVTEAKPEPPAMPSLFEVLP